MEIYYDLWSVHGSDWQKWLTIVATEPALIVSFVRFLLYHDIQEAGIHMYLWASQLQIPNFIDVPQMEISDQHMWAIWQQEEELLQPFSVKIWCFDLCV